MLVLSRRVGESIRVGDDVTITVTSIDGNRVRIGIEAPKHIDIVRSELIPQESSTPRVSLPEQTWACASLVPTA